MKIINTKNGYGIEKDKRLHIVKDLFSLKETGAVHTHYKPSCPVNPSKVVCIGRNYREHAKELGNPVPEKPLIFLKPSTSVIGPDEPIIFPEISEEVHYEGELAVVIKDRIRNLPEDKVMKHILGFTCLNDVTARDIQKEDGKFTRSKSFDTFCPIGPWIVTDLNPNDLNIQTRVNGEVVQAGNTCDFIFKIPELISFISQCMTLLPGDVVSTGTPAGVGPLKKGDLVEVEIEGIGILKNTVE